MYRIFVVLSLFLVLCSSQALSQKLDFVPIKKVISLELTEKPLKLVAEDIHKQTGYRVVFDEKWNELLLSGQYIGVTPEEFFLRALRKQNVTLSYDDKGKVVVLRFFGDRSVVKINKSILTSESVSNIKEEKDANGQHGKLLAAYLNDPEAVDPSNGMKISDIRESHATQQAELQRFLSDPVSVDPSNGMKIADILESRVTQEAELERLRNDPDAIDPMTGMKIADLQKQQAELKRFRNDLAKIDPKTNMTNTEIKKSHDQQTRK